MVADDAVWGRGTLDNKGSLVALFESLEALAKSGFAPAASVIVVSGHDEEAGGAGAAAAAQLLQSRGVQAEFVLDEGLAVVADFPLLGRPVALIGIAEKGYGTLRITAPAKGGHSSAPPPQTGVETLARAVLAITSQPFPMRFAGPPAEMLRALAPETSWPVRMAVANSWLFAPLLVKQDGRDAGGCGEPAHDHRADDAARQPEGERAAAGRHGLDQLPHRARPHRSRGARARAAGHARPRRADRHGRSRPYDPPPVSSATSPAFRLIATLAADGGRTPVAPGLVTATTDSRSFVGVARDIYRFQPIVASMREFEMIHGTNEHVTFDNLSRLTELLLAADRNGGTIAPPVRRRAAFTRAGPRPSGRWHARGATGSTRRAPRALRRRGS